MEHEKASLEAELAITSEAPVDSENSFQTPAISLPFAISRGLINGNYEMVEATGVEPATPWMQTRCSTN